MSPTATTPTVRISRRLRAAVGFARWSIRYGVDPLDLAQLRTLVDRRAKAWDRGNNDARESERSERAMARLDAQIAAMADRLGLALDWPGLYPTVRVIARPELGETMLPEV